MNYALEKNKNNLTVIYVMRYELMCIVNVTRSVPSYNYYCCNGIVQMHSVKEFNYQ